MKFRQHFLRAWRLIKITKVRAALLRNALLLVISASQLVAFRAVVVDGMGEKAKRFYEHFGFVQIKGLDMKLILSTADILKSSLEACDGRDCCQLIASCLSGWLIVSIIFLFQHEVIRKIGKKAVLSKREPAREPILYFVISLVFRPASS